MIDNEESLWRAQVDLMHCLNPRKQALELIRVRGQHRMLKMSIPPADDDYLLDKIEAHSNGVDFLGNPCQISATEFLDHGVDFPFLEDPPQAIRGLLVDFEFNGNFYLSCILDPGKSRSYYDQMPKAEKRGFVGNAVQYQRQITNYAIDTALALGREKTSGIPPLYFALVSSIPRGYRLNEFAQIC